MSRSKATKRRKVWANVYSWGVEQACKTRAIALRKFKGSVIVKGDRPAVPFIECLPGDVVLSREDVAELRELVQANLSATRPSGTDGRILALLRGRR